MQTLVALACGFVFGAGLAISGMTNPGKVLGFLDVLGDFDPTLAVVMGAALLVAAPGFALARRRARPWLAESFRLPTRSSVDVRLVLGAVLFGAGWGLVGLCPGPALANLSRLSADVSLFVASMLGAMLVHRVLTRPAELRSPLVPRAAGTASSSAAASLRPPAARQ
jgi:uncharacterized membrane protein YedE/YeeE